ncbi:hypothetical protein [Hyperthermus butylicus]|uniref:Uncharacterized protein n=1 Tax=Hyperthermus butylicus (strain DSM 5456 / JCM 9403 / PLM1-5) TaxID=415426 RepID=A2BL72_HYPBU|nr:hypothetical protein [Hyperthermus butylicus]ABM80733.1 hypothetical protein Hbut_0883 [Hyperthermus butylicus DSM 5456]
MIDNQLAELLYLAFILSTTILLIYTTLSILKLKKPEEESEVTPITLLRCSSCGYEKTRRFKEGDYVGLVDQGTMCPRCGKPMVVHAIYVEGESELISMTLFKKRRRKK